VSDFLIVEPLRHNSQVAFCSTPLGEEKATHYGIWDGSLGSVIKLAR